MKKAGFIFSIILFLAPNAFSFTMITDPQVFYAFFEKPTKTINFTELKDGTSYGTLQRQLASKISPDSESDCLNPSGAGLEAVPVLPGAFSDHWFFKGGDPANPSFSCDLILWFDQGISTGEHHLTVLAGNGCSQPFAMYTNKGFLGIVPDTPRETLFIFEDLHLIFSFETEFHKASPVSESRDSFLAKVSPD